MPSPRTDLIARVHDAVDSQWAVAVRFIPMRAGGTSYAEPMADLTREPCETVGVYRRINPQAIGLAGDRAGLPFIGRVSTEECYIGVTDTLLAAKGFVPRANDSVVVTLDDGSQERFTITRIDPSHNGRTRYHLIEEPPG